MYYGSIQWRNLRSYYIRRNPLCECCNDKGITRAADHVHHIVPFGSGVDDKERWRLLLDEDNLMSVCIDCHHNLHKKKNEHT